MPGNYSKSFLNSRAREINGVCIASGILHQADSLLAKFRNRKLGLIIVRLCFASKMEVLITFLIIILMASESVSAGGYNCFNSNTGAPVSCSDGPSSGNRNTNYPPPNTRPNKEQIRQQNIRNLKVLGDTAMRKGNWEEAIKYYKQALNLSPGDESIKAKIKQAESAIRRENAVAIHNRGIERLNMQDINGGIKLLEQALQEFPLPATKQELKKAKQRQLDAQKAFEKSKQESLSLLKGGSMSPHSGVSALQLKSGTATFGIKGNPSGQLQLKSPEPVRVKKTRSMTVEPSFFTRPRARLHIHTVPNPMQAPKGTWLRYVTSDRANLILDALEMSKGDLDKAIDYLDRQVIHHGSHRAASSALSYLEGLRTSYIAVGAEYRRQTKVNGQPVSVDSSGLLEAILPASRIQKWPGPTNPNPGKKPLNPDDWRVKRANKLLTALKASPGDLEKSYRILRSDKEIIIAADAEYYLRGAFAYWDFLAGQGGK